jgi:peptide/nickel transport system substrate-binding protein
MSSKKELEHLLNKETVTRRQFMGRAAALGVSTAIATSMFATSSKAAMAKKGGRLRLGLGGGSTTDSLDTGTLPDFMAQQLSMGQLRNCLVEIDADGKPIPELAESWESSPDAKEWTFKLRKGVEFHNGKTMDANDVIHSINHHRGEDSKSAAKAIVKSIDEMKADGKNTIVFKLNSGSADFPFVVSDYHLGVVPAGTTGKDMEKGMGTGGYMMDSHEPGVRALTKRNPNYWKEGRAHFDEIETIGIADANARTNALKTGEIDFMNRAETKTFHLLGRLPGVEAIKTTGTKHYTIPMHSDLAPYNNNDVRMALKYAIDREAVVKTVLRGHGLVGNDHPIAPSNQYFNKDLAIRKFDADKAKFHLKKAGMENHVFKLHASDAAFGGAVDTAVLYKEQAAKAGINIDVVREPKDGYWDNVWMKKEWTFSFWSGRPTEDWMFTIGYAAGGAWNESFWANDKFNKLMVAARAELNSDKRREMYYEMQQLCRDDGGSVIPMFASDLAGASKKLEHGKIAANWEGDGMKISERWWFG